MILPLEQTSFQFFVARFSWYTLKLYHRILLRSPVTIQFSVLCFKLEVILLGSEVPIELMTANLSLQSYYAL